VFLAFGQHQRRAAFSHTLNDFVADESIAIIVCNQFLVEGMKLHPPVRIGF
jgi:hypothetical protein